MNEIRTHFVNPPIPFRGWDWVAYLSGGEEGVCGSGNTESMAISNLCDRLDEVEGPPEEIGTGLFRMVDGEVVGGESDFVSI